VIAVGQGRVAALAVCPSPPTKSETDQVMRANALHEGIPGRTGLGSPFVDRGGDLIEKAYLPASTSHRELIHRSNLRNHRG